jgi:hypothetical protein
MEVGWNHHLTSDYQTMLYWVAYLQATRMVADTIAEKRSITALPEDFSVNHDHHTRLAMHHVFRKKAGCACTGCAGQKRKVIGHARLQAIKSIRLPSYRHHGPGVAL